VALLAHPAEKRRLIENPDLIKPAVEEILRYESSNQLGNRMTTERVELGGVVLDAGTPVTLCIGAANAIHRNSRSRTVRYRPYTQPPSRLRHWRPSMRRDGAGPARRRHRDLAVSEAVSKLCAGWRTGARRPGSVSRFLESAVRGRPGYIRRRDAVTKDVCSDQ